ncbi:MAG: hypothetical protein WCT46_03810 [Candidatus Gracilibacteria bacterium]|jgi:hypothetical protein
MSSTPDLQPVERFEAPDELIENPDAANLRVCNGKLDAAVAHIPNYLVERESRSHNVNYTLSCVERIRGKLGQTNSSVESGGEIFFDNLVELNQEAYSVLKNFFRDETGQNRFEARGATSHPLYADFAFCEMYEGFIGNIQLMMKSHSSDLETGYELFTGKLSNLKKQYEECRQRLVLPKGKRGGSRGAQYLKTVPDDDGNVRVVKTNDVIEGLRDLVGIGPIPDSVYHDALEADVILAKKKEVESYDEAEAENGVPLVRDFIRYAQVFVADVERVGGVSLLGDSVCRNLVFWVGSGGLGVLDPNKPLPRSFFDSYCIPAMRQIRKLSYMRKTSEGGKVLADSFGRNILGYVPSDWISDALFDGEEQMVEDRGRVLRVAWGYVSQVFERESPVYRNIGFLNTVCDCVFNKANDRMTRGGVFVPVSDFDVAEEYVRGLFPEAVTYASSAALDDQDFISRLNTEGKYEGDYVFISAARSSLLGEVATAYVVACATPSPVGGDGEDPAADDVGVNEPTEEVDDCIVELRASATKSDKLSQTASVQFYGVCLDAINDVFNWDIRAGNGNYLYGNLEVVREIFTAIWNANERVFDRSASGCSPEQVEVFLSGIDFNDEQSVRGAANSVRQAFLEFVYRAVPDMSGGGLTPEVFKRANLVRINGLVVNAIQNRQAVRKAVVEMGSDVSIPDDLFANIHNVDLQVLSGLLMHFQSLSQVDRGNVSVTPAQSRGESGTNSMSRIAVLGGVCVIAAGVLLGIYNRDHLSSGLHDVGVGISAAASDKINIVSRGFDQMVENIADKLSADTGDTPSDGGDAGNFDTDDTARGDGGVAHDEDTCDTIVDDTAIGREETVVEARTPLTGGDSGLVAEVPALSNSKWAKTPHNTVWASAVDLVVERGGDGKNVGAVNAAVTEILSSACAVPVVDKAIAGINQRELDGIRDLLVESYGWSSSSFAGVNSVADLTGDTRLQVAAFNLSSDDITTLQGCVIAPASGGSDSSGGSSASEKADGADGSSSNDAGSSSSTNNRLAAAGTDTVEILDPVEDVPGASVDEIVSSAVVDSNVFTMGDGGDAWSMNSMGLRVKALRKKAGVVEPVEISKGDDEEDLEELKLDEDDDDILLEEESTAATIVETVQVAVEKTITVVEESKSGSNVDTVRGKVGRFFKRLFNRK